MIKKIHAKDKLKIIAFIFWIFIISLFFYYKISNNLSFLNIASVIFNFIDNNKWSAIVFIGIYAIRPAIFFPATIMTVLSGSLFGFWMGVFYVMVGENLSASFAYFLGRYFGSDIIDQEKESKGFVGRWKKRMIENSFSTVLIMRFIYLPFDLVNYLSGILKIKWKEYFFATLIGIIPGVLTFVSFGASIENISELDLSKITISQTQLTYTVILFISSLILGRVIKRKLKIKD